MAFWSRPRRPPFPTDHDAEACALAAEATLTAALDRLDERDPEGALKPAPRMELRAPRGRQSEPVVPWRERMRDGGGQEVVLPPSEPEHI